MFAATWGEPRVAARGRLYDLRTLPTLVATRAVVAGSARDSGGTHEADEQIIGVLTYEIDGDRSRSCRSRRTPPHQGIGTALLAAAADLGKAEGLARCSSSPRTTTSMRSASTSAVACTSSKCGRTGWPDRAR